MKFNLTQTLIGVAGSIAVGAAVYVTKDGSCLWGLLLVLFMIEAADTKN